MTSDPSTCQGCLGRSGTAEQFTSPLVYGRQHPPRPRQPPESKRAPTGAAARRIHTRPHSPASPRPKQGWGKERGGEGGTGGGRGMSPRKRNTQDSLKTPDTRASGNTSAGYRKTAIQLPFTERRFTSPCSHRLIRNLSVSAHSEAIYVNTTKRKC